MVSLNYPRTIDRELLAPRRLSWVESVRALIGDVYSRVYVRMSRSRCEARLVALARTH